MDLFLPGPGPLLSPEAGRANIDRASPTPARSFDGVDDQVTTAAINQTGDFTIAALIRRTRSGTADPFISHRDSGAALALTFRFAAADTLSFSTATTRAGTTTIVPADGWVIVVVTKTAGTTTPRFHIYKSGVWAHENAGGTVADPVSQAGGDVILGTNATLFSPIDLAVLAEWQGTALTDANVETLSTNKRTADWTALSPQALWEFDQTDTAPPPDLVGGYHARAVTGTTAITTGPIPWTYDAATTTVVLLGSAAAQSAATLQLSAIVPLGPAAATSSATLALTAPAKLVLGQSDAVSSATLDLTAPSAGGPAVIPLETAAATSSATLALTAPALLALQTAAAQSSATLALTAPTAIPLATAAATSSATLALSAKTTVTLATAAATSSATLALSALTKLTLGQADAVSSATLALTAKTTVALATAAATSSATLSLTAQTKIVLGQADALSSATLALFAPGGGVVPLNSAVAVSSASLTLTAAGQVILSSATAISTATLTLVAKTTLVLGTAAAQSTASLDLFIPGAPSAGMDLPILMLVLDDDD